MQEEYMNDRIFYFHDYCVKTNCDVSNKKKIDVMIMFSMSGSKNNCFSTDIYLKGIYNPQYLPNDFFALSTFLDDLKPSHLNLSIQICPYTPQPEIG